MNYVSPKLGITASGMICLMMSMVGWSEVRAMPRPIPEKGPAATTLLLYADSRAPYALANGVERLSLQLGRIDTTVQPFRVQEVTPKQLSQADYVVVFCPTSDPQLPSALFNYLNASNGPVLWVGHGIGQLEALRPYFEQFDAVSDAASELATNVVYREREWPISPWPVVPILLTTNSAAEVHISIPRQSPSPNPSPVAWTCARTTFFAGLPETFETGALFGDLLLDFYGVRETAQTHLFVCIEGYHPGSNHGALQRKVDYLFARQIPFAVSLTPAFVDPATTELHELGSRPSFVESLHYAQSRGGRLVLSGFIHPIENQFEFWDPALDRPLSFKGTDDFASRLDQAVEQLTRRGLFPLAWETPQNTGPSTLRNAVAKHFAVALGKLQVTDATRLETYLASASFRDLQGRLFLPENLGSPVLSSTNQWFLLQARADFLLQLRGTLAGCEIPDYLPFNDFMALIQWLESLDRPFLDLAKLDLWVQWSGGLILTGRASQTLAPPPGPIHWKALNPSGMVVHEFTEPNMSGRARMFRNRGAGMLEIYEFPNANP